MKADKLVITPLGVPIQMVSELVGIAPSTIHKLVTLGEFPPPRRMTKQRVCWLYAELVEWINARPVSDLPPPPNCGKGRGRKPSRARNSD